MRLSLISQPFLKVGRILLLCVIGKLASAQAGDIKPLEIGDKVPEIVFSTMVNYSKPTAKLSDFKGKPIILDFWATWCGSCLAALPHVNALSKQFSSQAQFIIVDTKSTHDTKSKVDWKLRDLSASREYNGLNIPAAVEDTITDKLFKHKSIPHYVWIDQYGVVKYITGYQELNAENVRKFVSGENLQLHLKNDYLSYDRQKLFFGDGNGMNQSDIKYRVSITGYLNNIGVQRNWEGNDSLHCTRIVGINLLPADLYSLAIDELSSLLSNIPKNRIICHESDSAILDISDDDTDFFNKRLSVELISPTAPVSAIKKRLKEELDSYFRWKSDLIDTTLTCYGLRLSTSPARLPITSPHAQNYLENQMPPGRFFSNSNMSEVTALLNRISSIPIIDQTGITSTFNIAIPQSFNTLQELEAVLKNYGLYVVPLQQKLRMFYVHRQ